ncbi:Rid family detoxifying hydrolase [Paenibacillus peoriae]|uniref:Rid family detoxifying hydrolase n=1 Tax=Paenibacillus peoriae TaxID=59893 RepID=UPI00026C56B5|nr:Rid family detoxifying hydrolase [Paenibacillus peoriae]MEC0184799.1 Rid family detoxifying hydrolase [Paenibacillus peoriae]
METINSKQAPKALGPYCHGTKIGNLIFTSGQIPLDPVTNQLVTETRQATRLVLTNLLSIVEAGGGKLETIAKVDIFVKSLENYSTLNEEYAAFFGEHKPARVITQVADLPAKATLEMAMVAHVTD